MSNNVPESEVIKAVLCDVPLGESTLDAYMLPNGDKRFGIEGASIAFGYTNAGFTTVQKDS